MCIYDVHLFHMTFNLRFLYILIYFLGGAPVFIQQQNNFITMHLPTFILKEHSLFSDLICLPMTYDVTRVIKKWTSANIWSLCSFIVTKKRKHWLIKVKIKKKRCWFCICVKYTWNSRQSFFFFGFHPITNSEWY